MITVHLNREPETNPPLPSAKWLLSGCFNHRDSQSNHSTYYCFLRRAFKVLSGNLTHGSMFLLISMLSQAFKRKAALFLFLLQAVFDTVVLSVSPHSP